MHWLLLKSFHWQAIGLRRFDEHTPPLISTLAFAWVVEVSWFNAALVWIFTGATRRRGWANLAAAGRGTRLYCGWALHTIILIILCYVIFPNTGQAHCRPCDFLSNVQLCTAATWRRSQRHCHLLWKCRDFICCLIIFCSVAWLQPELQTL